MIGVWPRILDGLDRHGRVAMVTMAAIRGSSPREAGARLIVYPDGSFTGTVGGGTLEWKAIAMAQAALAKLDAPKAETRGFALGPELGQCCGGNVELVVELIEGDKREQVAEFARMEAAGPTTTSGRLSREHGVLRAVASTELPPGAAAYAAGLLTEGFGDDRRPLILFGAGHVGRALVLALAPLPFRVTWIDPRPDAFPAHVPGNATTRRADNPVPALADAPHGAFVLVMTHSHQLDLAVVAAALADDRFPYVGLIGSRSKRARFEKRLAASGIALSRIADLVCPIGVDGIAGKAPAVIAAATVAELIMRDEALRAGSMSDEQPAGNPAVPDRATG
jgi:xanthine dehydrogenase accessory factor